jgi:hypothetical protein
MTGFNNYRRDIVPGSTRRMHPPSVQKEDFQASYADLDGVTITIESTNGRLKLNGAERGSV